MGVPTCIWQRSSRVRTPTRHQSSPSREMRTPRRSSQRPTVSSSTKRPPMRTSTVWTWFCRPGWGCCLCSSVGDTCLSPPACHNQCPKLRPAGSGLDLPAPLLTLPSLSLLLPDSPSPLPLALPPLPASPRVPGTSPSRPHCPPASLTLACSACPVLRTEQPTSSCRSRPGSSPAVLCLILGSLSTLSAKQTPPHSTVPPGHGLLAGLLAPVLGPITQVSTQQLMTF